MHQRLITLIEKTTVPERRFKQLEALTCIAASSWQKVYVARQRPTVEMIEAICRLYPQCVLWLTTGVTDDYNKQINIDVHVAMQRHQLDAIQTKSPAIWTADEAMVVKFYSIAEARDGVLAQKFKALYEEYIAKRVCVFESPLSAHFWRDGDGPHTNIRHDLRLFDQDKPFEFEWGYFGTGSRELAANVLMHFGCSEAQSRNLATFFAKDVIAFLNRDQDEIAESEVKGWLKRKGSQTLSTVLSPDILSSSPTVKETK